MAVNDDLSDAMIRRAIYLERVKNGVWKDLRKILRAVERELIEKVEQGTGTTVQSRRTKALLKEISTLIKEGAAKFQERLDETGLKLAEIEAAGVGRTFSAVIPVRMEWAIPSAQLLEATIAAQPFQGAFLKDWIEEWSAATISRVEKQLRIGIVEGEPVETIVRRLIGTKANDYADGILETSRRSARTLVRTYLNHVGTSAREAVYEANSDIIDRVVWVSTLDSRTSLICMGLDGKVFPIGEGPRPPAHPNCRSVVAPLTKGREALIKAGLIPKSTRASMDGQVPDNLTFDDWLRKKPAAFQDDVLGPSRAEMFRNGAKLDRFTDDQNRVLTLDELSAL